MQCAMLDENLHIHKRMLRNTYIILSKIRKEQKCEHTKFVVVSCSG